MNTNMRLLAALVATLLAGCGSFGERHEPVSGPDPTATVVISPGVRFVEESELATRLGVHGVYQHESGSRVIVSFEPRPEVTAMDAGARLDAHVSRTNDLLVRTVRGKRVVALDGMEDNPFAAAGVPWRAFGYLNGEGATAICDSAAMMGVTEGGVWTVSWNTSVGSIHEAERVVELFFRGMKVIPSIDR